LPAASDDVFYYDGSIKVQARGPTDQLSTKTTVAKPPRDGAPRNLMVLEHKCEDEQQDEAASMACCEYIIISIIALENPETHHRVRC